MRLRASELDISLIRQSASDKLSAVQEILGQLDLTFEQICFIGDDLPDIPPIRHAALGVAVADAVSEVIDAADYVTEKKGGFGAVRETIELILKSQRRWQSIVQHYW